MGKVERPAPKAKPCKKSWRDVVKVHPAAELFPLMSKEELHELAADIKKNHMRQRITFTLDGQLVDGRNRLDALALNGADVARSVERIVSFIRGNDKTFVRDGPIGPHQFDAIKEEWAYDHVVSLNIKRRHLTPVQKRDIIDKLLKQHPERSDRATAKVVGVSKNTVASVRADAEARGQIDHVETRTDTKGRKQPARKPAKSGYKKGFIEALERQGGPEAVKRVLRDEKPVEVNGTPTPPPFEDMRTPLTTEEAMEQHPDYGPGVSRGLVRAMKEGQYRIEPKRQSELRGISVDVRASIEKLGNIAALAQQLMPADAFFAALETLRVEKDNVPKGSEITPSHRARLNKAIAALRETLQAVTAYWDGIPVEETGASPGDGVPRQA
jgi:hypothetical protein